MKFERPKYEVRTCEGFVCLYDDVNDDTLAQKLFEELVASEMIVVIKHGVRVIGEEDEDNLIK